MKKKYNASFKDKKDWINFTRQINNIRPKEVDLFQENVKTNKVPKLDLHGFSLEESNKKVKKFIIESSNRGYKKLLVITGKGLRSKSYSNPYISEKSLNNPLPNKLLRDFLSPFAKEVIICS